MRKVLVDREMLERIARDDEGAASFADFEELKRVLAQPAEAEGELPEPYGWIAVGELYMIRENAIRAAGKTSCIGVYTRPQLLAALSAVTAERDRVLAEREGNVLVPTEPTEAMLTAYSTNPNHVASAGAIYRAMLSAAMAAKETEPEHVCSGCGAKGWTGNCLACIPY